MSLISQVADECHHLIACLQLRYEYIRQSSPSHITIAEQMLSTGVDSIAGSHARIVQSAAQIQGKTAFLSMGTISSDYWQTSIAIAPCWRYH